MKTLDASQPQKTSYCIPAWLGQEQMKLSIARLKGRISAEPLKDGPIAVICFGPSLNDTWQEAAKFDTWITCSGSHKFMAEKGVRPKRWLHTEVDPREHKCTLLGSPQYGVEYLIASCCHPKLFDLLDGMDVKLWHVFANDAERSFPELFPRGEWTITGGSSVGLRAMTIARFLGYRDLHVFGMDGSFPAEGSRHAADHPNRPPENFVTTYEGKNYCTTPSFLHCAKETFHELDMMTDVNATFHGEGLVQDMARKYVRKPIEHIAKNLIAFSVPETISVEYRDLNAKLHKDNLAYGVGGGKHAETVTKLANSIKAISILDYGCGKGFLAKALKFPIWEYDPCVPGKDATPRPADLVVCTDVLEHIEPEKLECNLQDLKRCVKKLGYFVIHTGPSGKTLADGRNSHLIQQPKDWWRTELSKHFTLAKDSIIEKPPLLYVIVAPKTK